MLYITIKKYCLLLKRRQRLDVVKKRLDELGLVHFCLSLQF